MPVHNNAEIEKRGSGISCVPPCGMGSSVEGGST